MLCEGIYLHTLIVVAVFAEEQRLHWYYLLGWGMYIHLQLLGQVIPVFVIYYFLYTVALILPLLAYKSSFIHGYGSLPKTDHLRS